MRNWRPGRAGREVRPLSVMGALVLLLVGLGGTGSAWAHEGEETARASESIRQAIAYIVNDPENMDAIVDKVEDSLKADDTSAVKLELVRRAQSALERDEMMRARRLLERAIGARSDMAGTDVRPVLQVPPGSSTTPLAVGSETGTSVVTDEMPGRGSLTGADIVLLGFAGVLGIADALLSVRLRPPDSVRALRRRARLAGRS